MKRPYLSIGAVVLLVVPNKILLLDVDPTLNVAGETVRQYWPKGKRLR